MMSSSKIAPPVPSRPAVPPRTYGTSKDAKPPPPPPEEVALRSPLAAQQQGHHHQVQQQHTATDGGAGTGGRSTTHVAPSSPHDLGLVADRSAPSTVARDRGARPRITQAGARPGAGRASSSSKTLPRPRRVLSAPGGDDAGDASSLKATVIVSKGVDGSSGSTYNYHDTHATAATVVRRKSELSKYKPTSTHPNGEPKELVDHDYEEMKDFATDLTMSNDRLRLSLDSATTSRKSKTLPRNSKPSSPTTSRSKKAPPPVLPTASLPAAVSMARRKLVPPPRPDQPPRINCRTTTSGSGGPEDQDYEKPYAYLDSRLEKLNLQNRTGDSHIYTESDNSNIYTPLFIEKRTTTGIYCSVESKTSADADSPGYAVPTVTVATSQPESVGESKTTPDYVISSITDVADQDKSIPGNSNGESEYTSLSFSSKPGENDSDLYMPLLRTRESEYQDSRTTAS